VIVTSRSAPKNYDCPKCGGHLWRNDSISVHEQKRLPSKHWWARIFSGANCFADCPDGEHVHRIDRCGDCGTNFRRTEPTRERE
jgi:hypothetical protein